MHGLHNLLQFLLQNVLTTNFTTPRWRRVSRYEAEAAQNIKIREGYGIWIVFTTVQYK